MMCFFTVVIIIVIIHTHATTHAETSERGGCHLEPPPEGPRRWTGSPPATGPHSGSLAELDLNQWPSGFQAKSLSRDGKYSYIHDQRRFTASDNSRRLFECRANTFTKILHFKTNFKYLYLTWVFYFNAPFFFYQFRFLHTKPMSL